MSRYQPMDRQTAQVLATTIRDQFKRFSLDEGKLVDLLTQVHVPPLDRKFKRRRYEIPDNGFVPSHQEIEQQRIDPYTVLSLDLVIYNRKTPARDNILLKLIKDYRQKWAMRLREEGDIERLKKRSPVDAYIFYRAAVVDPNVAQSMANATKVFAPYSVSGRLIEKRHIYDDSPPIEVTLPMLFIPFISSKEQDYLGALGKAHQYPAEDTLIEQKEKHEPSLE